MKLSDFLANMQGSDVKVAVTEKQLRQFAQQSFGWEGLAKEQGKTIKKLMAKIDRLETKLILKGIKEPVTIDLFT